MPPSTETLPATVRPSVTAVPVTSMPVDVVASLGELLLNKVTAPPVVAVILFALFAALFISTFLRQE